jgi:hypothetical protein
VNGHTTFHRYFPRGGIHVCGTDVSSVAIRQYDLRVEGLYGPRRTRQVTWNGIAEDLGLVQGPKRLALTDESFYTVIGCANNEGASYVLTCSGEDFALSNLSQLHRQTATSLPILTLRSLPSGSSCRKSRGVLPKRNLV